MGEVLQHGWTRVRTPNGRYECQFQGRSPAVRNGDYKDANDYQFLVMDENGWLYKIPVRVAAEAEAAIETSAAPGGSISAAMLRIAEAQLRAGLARFQPRPNAPYAELDAHFSVDAARDRELAGAPG
jgi:hypothetical protein